MRAHVKVHAQHVDVPCGNNNARNFATKAILMKTALGLIIKMFFVSLFLLINGLSYRSFAWFG